MNEREAKAGVLTPLGECCTPAPPVLEFDAEGNLVGSWGGPGDGYDWPTTNHGIAVDPMDNVWIGGNGPDDAHILKFTRNGQFLLQLGKPGGNAGSRDATNFGRAAKVSFDVAANEAFVADGYLNKRVAVLDMSSGAMKRYWGAYGNPPDDTDLGAYDPDAPPAPQFRNPVHCAEPTLDGLVYVCDRVNDRIQVFRKDGTFVSELRVAPQTRGGGSVWDIAFSRDAGADVYFPRRRRQRARLDHRARDDADSDELRRRRAATGAVLRRAQHCHGFAAATSTRPKRSKGSASRNS